ncbi:hypothetical protein TMatcc_008799 [Talaromyces marneffei ATCC 18224]
MSNRNRTIQVLVCFVRMALESFENVTISRRKNPREKEKKRHLISTLEVIRMACSKNPRRFVTPLPGLQTADAAEAPANAKYLRLVSPKLPEFHNTPGFISAGRLGPV